MDDFQKILDFDCGRGRVTRNFGFLKTKIFGTDCHWEAIQWCKENLSFGNFQTNSRRPPLDCPSSQFDFMYCFSVFTHLSEFSQHLWIEELARILKPGGCLLLLLHGEFSLKKIGVSDALQKEFYEGGLVVINKEASGTNRCVAFHPEKYVREHLVKGFEIVDFIPQGAVTSGGQDIYLLRKDRN